jgi:hypothetical protein
MPSSTPNRSYPYPLLTDTPNGAGQMQSLATAIDSDMATQVSAITTANANIARSTAGPVVAKMYQQTAQTGIATGNWTKDNLGGVDIDPSSVCNTSTFRIVPGVLGYYQAFGRVSYAGGTPGSRFAALYKNGAQLARVAGGMTAAVGAGSGGSFSQPVQVTSTSDYFELWTFQDSGSSFSMYVDSINCCQLGLEFIRTT